MDSSTTLSALLKASATTERKVVTLRAEFVLVVGPDRFQAQFGGRANEVQPNLGYPFVADSRSLARMSVARPGVLADGRPSMSAIAA
jgi:hypothetical protein